MADFTLLFAPNINSYKRFADGSFAPTAIAWGEDNRTCAVRLVGHGRGARMENRRAGGRRQPVPRARGDAGRWPARHRAELELEDALVGNAYTSDKPQVPHTLRGGTRRLPGSALARRPGRGGRRPLHQHGGRRARRVRAAVTDWELRRGFERM
jgi:glutamine synthetase